jgi:tRNA (cytidine/uridine-2'-O-)-methyltransferase
MEKTDNNLLHIVLVEPEIPQNTGNIGRTCVGLGATLHLVGELGFSLEAKDVKRAGLDYWAHLKLMRHLTWDAFEAALPAEASLFFFSTKGSSSLWDMRFRAPVYFVFGSESRGLPPSFYKRFRESLVRIPIEKEIRSLNLATAVGIAAYDAARQLWHTLNSKF